MGNGVDGLFIRVHLNHAYQFIQIKEEKKQTNTETKVDLPYMRGHKGEYILVSSILGDRKISCEQPSAKKIPYLVTKESIICEVYKQRVT